MQCDFMGGEKYIASVPCLEKKSRMQMTSFLTLARVSELHIIILKPPYGRAEICSTYLTRS